MTIAGTRPPAILDRAAVAAQLGIEPDSVTRSVRKTRDRIAAEKPVRLGDFPEPNGHVGHLPYWYEETIARYEANRLGQGAGGGRPKKVPAGAGEGP